MLKHRERLRALAADQGLSRPRVDGRGVVIVHAPDPGYANTLRFAQEASATVGSWVHVITDDVPAARVDADDP